VIGVRAATVVVALALALTGCRSDGRDLRQPTAPLPPTTTTTTTVPTDPIAP
jgi:hypothetical protein